MYLGKPLICFTDALLRQCGRRSASSFNRILNNGSSLPYVSKRIFPRAAFSRLPSLICRTKSNDAEEMPPIDIKRSPEELKEIEENRRIEDKVKQWLKTVVIGLNLCPFAERPMREKNLRIFTVRGADDEKLLSSIMVVLLLQEQIPGTSIIVAPECYPDDFEAYLDVVNMIEKGLLEDNDMVGVLQVAPFHPLFRFEGSDLNGVDNWTNRAPYPIFHVLREDEVERAADSLEGDASRVWKRNVGLLEALEDGLGSDGVERVFTSKATIEEKARVEEILKDHRLVMKPKN